MEIKLNKDYKIITDEHNYTLYCKKDKSKRPKHKNISEDVEVGWKVVGYYQDLDYLFSELIERHIRLSNAKTFPDILLSIKDLKHALIKRFTP